MNNLDKLFSLIPLEEIEPEAMKQIYDALDHDFLIKLVIMPDVHCGYDLPIGGVALLDGKVSPSYVGYDIGCGMCFIDTKKPIEKFLPDDREKQRVFNDIYREIPVGFNSRKREIDYKVFNTASENPELNVRVWKKLNIQLGTLGGGNHFIEIGKNTQGNMCITIHCGSRNIGHSIGGFYMNKGQFFDEGSDMGIAYVADMRYAMDYALANRKILMELTLEILGFGFTHRRKLMEKLVNENHNTAEWIDGGWLHRKGATPAEEGKFGVIPGSMKGGVALTVGLGNETYLKSASHGAGRCMSRKKAKQNINVDQFKELMNGIVAKVDQSTLDECPLAYKNFETVLKYQDGVVVNVIDTITPLINIKG